MIAALEGGGRKISSSGLTWANCRDPVSWGKKKELGDVSVKTLGSILSTKKGRERGRGEKEKRFTHCFSVLRNTATRDP